MKISWRVFVYMTTYCALTAHHRQRRLFLLRGMYVARVPEAAQLILSESRSCTHGFTARGGHAVIAYPRSRGLFTRRPTHGKRIKRKRRCRVDNDIHLGPGPDPTLKY